MRQGLNTKLRSLKRDLKNLNSYCTLYEEKLRDKLDSSVVDELIIESKQLYLKYEILEEKSLDLGL